MRIVHVTTSYPERPGGTSGRFVHRLCARLVASGHDVEVLAPSSADADERVEDGVAIRYVRYAPAGLERVAHGRGIAASLREQPLRVALVPGLLAALAAAAARHARGADVVHAHWLPTAVAARAARRPLVVTAHGSDLALAARAPLAARLAVRGAEVIVGSQDAARRLAALAPDASARIVPPEGVDVDPRPFAEADPDAVLCVARLVPEKGIHALAAAWPAVRLAHPGARLDVVGDGPLAALLAPLPGVRLHGALPHAALGARYAAAACIVVPSRREGFGLVAAEALARGRAVVGTRAGALPDLLDGVDAGALVDVDRPDALAAALVAALADPARLAAQGAAGALRARERLGWAVVVAGVEDAYRSALERRSRL